MDFKIATVNCEKFFFFFKKNQPSICFKDAKNPNYQLLAKCVYIYIYIHIYVYIDTHIQQQNLQSLSTWSLTL